MKTTLFTLLVLASATAFGQTLSRREISINGFRAPSVGLEFRHKAISVHAGYYPTALKPYVNTNFLKAGATAWFLPVGKKENPSSFYASVNYLRGFSSDHDGKNAFAMDAGFRWMIWKGLNLRIGVIGLTSEVVDFKLNPAGGLSYSFFIR